MTRTCVPVMMKSLSTSKRPKSALLLSTSVSVRSETVFPIAPFTVTRPPAPASSVSDWVLAEKPSMVALKKISPIPGPESMVTC
ncbi:MAG UNVERIFIED_CONTAM: hypothetical protein LVR18_14400 [Planctomycetaceae bacterium]